MAHEYTIVAHHVGVAAPGSPVLFAKPAPGVPIPFAFAERDELPPSPKPGHAFRLEGLTPQRRFYSPDGTELDAFNRFCHICRAPAYSYVTRYDQENRRCHQIPYCDGHQADVEAAVDDYVIHMTERFDRLDTHSCHWCRQHPPSRDCSLCDRPAYCSNDCEATARHLNPSITKHACVVTASRKQALV